MSARHLMIVCLCLFGCQSRDDMPPWPPFHMTIPDDIAAEIIVTESNGRQRSLDGRELYTSGYRAGWRECVRRYEQKKLDLAAIGGEMPHGAYGPAVQGWDDGYQTCLCSIREALENEPQ